MKGWQYWCMYMGVLLLVELFTPEIPLEIEDTRKSQDYTPSAIVVCTVIQVYMLNPTSIGMGAIILVVPFVRT